MCRAIILAAGSGTRLFPLTSKSHKTLTEINGISILDNMLDVLYACGVTDIVIITGYRDAELQQHIFEKHINKSVKCIYNDKFKTTNNIYSLWLAREFFKDDFLLLEADVFFEKAVIERLCADNKDKNIAAIARYNINLDGTLVSLNSDKSICSFIDPKDQAPDLNRYDYFKTINFYKIKADYATKRVLPALEEKVRSNDLNDYYETIFSDDVHSNQIEFQTVDCTDLKWFEVDNLNDLFIAEFIFKPEQIQLEEIRSLYGGFWRLDMVDHCLLYNFHYPPKKLLNHMAGRLPELLKYYPAGQKNLSNFLAKTLNVKPEYIALGNGSSEFIKILGQNADGLIVIPTPTFDEYINASKAEICPFELNAKNDFDLNIEEFIDFSLSKKAKYSILINPNNPTSRKISKEDISLYISEVQAIGTTVILDESFLDFCEEGEHISFLQDLEDYSNLVIFKSMSKTHGIGGARIGYAASSNIELINFFREKTSIWNMNGLAEEYLRIFSAYDNDFKVACRKVIKDISDFHKLLSSIPEIKAFEPNTNYIFCQLLSKEFSVDDMALDLFLNNRIYVKNCSDKNMNKSQSYFRVSVRTEEDNLAFIEALKASLNRLKKRGKHA